ncbi:MAG: TonB-dependent receptor [Dysgonamonadaceae bacterium]|jgi:TonB-linked SusC/RagA family outer membrane protein|nr:TonB-dependent receptor [Dysgonamonadaceae bacterium]
MKNTTTHKLGVQIFFVAVFIFLFHPATFSQNQTVKIQGSNLTLKTAFAQIEKQTNLIVGYEETAFNVNAKIEREIKSTILKDVLIELLQGTNCSFKIQSGHIFIFHETPAKNGTTSHKITGNVTDVNGDPQTGVSVVWKENPNIGSVTDFGGNYSLLIQDNQATLIFSYLGFQTREEEVGGRKIINVVLQEEMKQMDEVVVVGYGTQRKISTVGAQSGIKNMQEMKQPVANISSVLAGRIAGVVGIQGSGEAGKDDNTQIWIRGVSTTTNTTPLILVDGVERTFNNIDPEDIESFQVLKDASATAVYGVKGANGVILINTKKGLKGKPRVKAEYNTGITTFTKIPELADGITYMQMANEAAMNKGETPIYSAAYINKTYTQSDPSLYPNVNWMKEIFKNHGTYHKANINARGGSEFAQFYTSLGYYNEGGLYNERPEEKYDGSMTFNRVNFVTNLTMQATKTTNIDFGVKGEIADYNTPYYSARDIFKMITRAYPIMYPTSYSDGKIPYLNNGGGVTNPYAMVYRMGSNKRNTSETRADLRVDQKLDFWLNGLSVRALIAYDFYMRNDIQRIGTNPITWQATGRDENNELILTRTDNMSGDPSWSYNKHAWGHRQYYLESALNYQQIFKNIHRVSAMLLYNMTDYSNVTAGTLMHAMPFRNMGIAGRATYSYNDRYFGEANFGYNGAENFSPGKRFGFFPSFGAAWVASNESFFEPAANYISFLKFRFSWGQAGNSMLDNAAKGESNARFVYLATVESGNGYTYGEGNSKENRGGVRVGRPAIDVTWETSTKKNVGIDFNVRNNDLSFQIDFFKEHRENIFLQRQAVPTYIGIVTLPYGNLGVIDNRGFEVTTDLTRKFGNWIVMFKGNFSFNQNEYVEDDTPQKPYDYLNSRGHSLETKFGYICDGFYTQEDIDDSNVAKPKGIVVKPGDLKYRNLNPQSDNVIDASDKTYIGYPSIPQIVYGFGGTIGWKNWTLGAFFQGVSRRTLSLSATDFKPFTDGAAKGNLYANITERWTPDNPRQDALWPRLDYGLTSNSENYATSTFWLRDGSYLRLKSLDLTYNIPERMTKKIGLNNVRVYFGGYNLLTFTRFNMWDVELREETGSEYPNIKTYSVGVNFSF